MALLGCTLATYTRCTPTSGLCHHCNSLCACDADVLVCSRPQVRVEYPDELPRDRGRGAASQNALYFSTLGGRLADEIKGSD